MIGSLALMGRMTGLPFVLGVKPYATLLVFGLLLKLGWISDPFFLTPAYASFQNSYFLAIVGVLFLGETLADKIPLVDHALDLVHTILKPLAGAFLGFVSVRALDEGQSMNLVVLATAVVGGGALGLMTHATKATVRVGSTKLTLGFGNAILSLVEDVLAILGTILTVRAPWLIGGIVIVFTLFFICFAPLVLRVASRLVRKTFGVLSRWLGLGTRPTVPDSPGAH